MDKNRDGVVTIEEFIETCQKVIFDTLSHQHPKTNQTLKQTIKNQITTNHLSKYRTTDHGVMVASAGWRCLISCWLS